MNRTSVLLTVLVVGSMLARSQAAYPAIQTPNPTDSQSAPAQDLATPAPIQDQAAPGPVSGADEQAIPAQDATTTDVSAPTTEQATPAPDPVAEAKDPVPVSDPSTVSDAAIAAKKDPANIGGGIIMILLMVAAVAFFLSVIPTLIAFRRRHKDRKAILVLSIFFGWLPFAWVIGLIWSLTGNVEPLQASA